jgi:hypothetical protein
MKKILLLSGLLIALGASIASAAGNQLAWTSCDGPDTKTFTCTTNTGLHNVMASVAIPVDMLNWVGSEVFIELQADGATLPLWWQMRNAGTCRAGTTVLSASAAGFGAGCADAYGGAGSGGIGAYTIGYGGANRARIIAGAAVPDDPSTADDNILLTAEELYASINVQFNSVKSTGLGACAGCQTGVCLVLVQTNLRQPAGAPGGDQTVNHSGARNWVKWQNPIQSTCDGATPAKRSTWSSVKSLYR